MKTLYLTQSSIYPNFKSGYIGLLSAQGVLLLNFPNDLESGLLLGQTQQPLWQGHAGSRDAIRFMQQTRGFALLHRLGIVNPFEELDLSALGGRIEIQPPDEDLEAESLEGHPEAALVQAQSDLLAFLAGEIGYVVEGGILSVQTPHDPSSCTLEQNGLIVWAGDAHSDRALALISEQRGTVELTLQPGGHVPLQA